VELSADRRVAPGGGRKGLAQRARHQFEAGAYDGQTVAKCLSDATGGVFVSTETVDELTEALRETLGCALIGRSVPKLLRRRG
jgi:hypothetical protein